MNEITASKDQEPLFAAADAGLTLLMERNGQRYYVVNEAHLERFVSFVAPRIRAHLGEQRPGLRGFAPMSGDAIRRAG